jgi:hypothetical protein
MLNDAGAWRLCVTVAETMKYILSAADILYNPGLNGSNVIDGMDGHLEAISFERDSPLELASQSTMPALHERAPTVCGAILGSAQGMPLTGA